MRDTSHFKRHLAVVTRTHWAGESRTDVSQVQVEDPFHNTRVVMSWSLWKWLKLLFRWNRSVEITVLVEADGCAMGRWFQGADICEECKHARIDLAGSHPDKPGYQSRGMQICEACYYRHPIEASLSQGEQRGEVR